MERSCLIVKPDGVGKRKIGEVMARLEKEGGKLVGIKMLKLSRPMAEKFYEVHIGKIFFEPFINFVTSGPVVVTAWEGENIVELIRKIIGATDSRKALPGTLRQLFGTDNRRNLVHASDSLIAAQREIAYFFAPAELHSYSAHDWQNK
ncbi:MAG: nucleoside-diphosphate kinase [Elusimicrobiota bacterium]